MDLHARHLIGAGSSRDGEPCFHGVDPKTGAELAPAYADATSGEVDTACALANAAHPAFDEAGRAKRAALLDSIAEGIEAVGDPLIERAMSETGLPKARLEGERGRTCAQLRMFARVVRDGNWVDARIDRADPARLPAPKPDVRSMNVPIGPVAVFGASNFPLAFSVAGGDTASALAAGCPVIVKAHPNHPGTSEIVGQVIVEAVRAAALPEGVFSLLHGRSHEVGLAVTRADAVCAVAFTGSLAGGRALMDAAAARVRPIPVFAEMGSTNPVFVLRDRLARDADLPNRVAGSVTLGVGQFCTSPGLLIMRGGDAADSFLAVLADALSEVPEATMLHAGIRAGFQARLAEISAIGSVEVIVAGGAAAGLCGARPSLLAVPATAWLQNPALQEEVFGPATLVVLCSDDAQVLAVAHALPGQLSVTILGEGTDHAASADLRRTLALKTGRLVFEGMPTGVEVSEAIVHGGPYPATSDPRGTSVGTRAIGRFLRPLAWQDCPPELLPPELRDRAEKG